MFKIPEISFQVKHIKVLQEIKYMGKPLQDTIGFAELLGTWRVKDTSKYTGRVLTNWDYECNKAYDKVVINYATYYKHNTKKELYKMACDNRIASRSHMKKKQLIIALLKL